MRKIEISGRLAACASALVLAGSTLAACGGSSATTPSGSPAARAGTSSTAAAHPTLGSSTSPSNKALSAKTRSQIAQRLRSLRSRATSGHATAAPAVQQAAFRSALTRFAGCLRQEGVKIPAPNASGRGPLLSMRGVNTNSPQYRSALRKCRGVLLAAFRQAAHARR